MPIDELKGTKPVESIDLSGKGLEVASGIIIAACIKENAVLKELKYASHPIPRTAFIAYEASHLCALTLPCSLADNQLQAKGCKAVVAVLDKTQITSLKCASPTPPSA